MDNDLPNHFQIQGNQKYTATIDSQGPLRRSLFGGVPPFINYVPAGGFSGGVEKGPQYWDANTVINKFCNGIDLKCGSFSISFSNLLKLRNNILPSSVNILHSIRTCS